MNGDLLPSADVLVSAIGRIAVFLWLLATALLVGWAALSGTRPDRIHRARTARRPASPSRQSVDELRRIVAGAATRGFYRSILAGRLRTCARDRLNLDLGLTDQEAFAAIRDGKTPWPPGTLDCALDDHLASSRSRHEPVGTGPHGDDFLSRAERLLDALETGRVDRDGNGGADAPHGGTAP